MDLQNVLHNMKIHQKRLILAALFTVVTPALIHTLHAQYRKSAFHKTRRQTHLSFSAHLKQAEMLEAQKRSAASSQLQKVAINGEFFWRLRFLLGIVIPRWRSKEMALLVMHTISLICRTWLSVLVARIDGKIVKDLVGVEGTAILFSMFLQTHFIRLGGCK